MIQIPRTTLLLAFVALFVFPGLPLQAGEPCEIRVVDESNGWPVPLVQLQTIHNVTFVSDNAGVIAFDLPELMGKEVWFAVEGHGYGVTSDGFGYQGVRLTPYAGETITVKVKRNQFAKRLGRLTGAGLFAESQKLGRYSDWEESGVLGCDSLQLAQHNGQLFWCWGDTNLSGYPLGVFDMSSATTRLKPLASFEPPVRLSFEYFRDASGQPRGVAKMPGSGPTWLSGYVSLPDQTGKKHLVGTYVKITPPLSAYELGQCVWNESAQEFEPVQILWEKSAEEPEPPVSPEGHPVFWQDETGKEWLLLGDPFPRLKLPATYEAYFDDSAWERLSPQESVPTKKDGKEITPHRGSIAWNAYRSKWVTVFTQFHGDSVLGEIWYAEADHPQGPWQEAVKVLTHNQYTFYNPRLHPELTPADSPVLLFEGTYTRQFSGNPVATPRYDYNQILYRIDLNELSAESLPVKPE